MKFGSLFAGIGGFDLGLERAGMECAWQVEIDDYCNQVLAKHWPNITRHKDVREVGKHNLEPVDLICGGFPCQPFSAAGKREGAADDRHLWPEMLRIIQELRPTWIFGENVAGFVSMALDDVLSDLEAEGYTTFPLIIPACAVDAKHRRDRVWIMAHNACNIRRTPNGRGSNVADAPRVGRRGRNNGNKRRSERTLQTERPCPPNQCKQMAHATIKGLPDWAGGEMEQPQTITQFERHGKREIERNFCGMAYGVSRRVDRLRSLGNAVVPQIVEVIGKNLMTITESLCPTKQNT